MARPRHPRRGSMQFWPRARSRHPLARIRSWAKETKVKPLGFIGYKAGMIHVQVTNNRPKSITKGETIAMASTIVDCPPMVVAGAVFYKKTLSGLQAFATVLAEKTSKDLARQFPLPKKATKKIGEVAQYDDARLLVHSQPTLASTGARKPKLLEIALGGSPQDKLAYIKSMLGKEITVNDIFNRGAQIDVHGITKGKGFQGTVKRYGIPIRQHKAEKTKRGIGNLGSWTPKRVEFSVALPGKMGYHLRTEYNKQLLRLGANGEEVTSTGGIIKYGVVRGAYALLKGSIIGPQRRAVVLTQSIRPNRYEVKEAPEITYLSVQK
ncbi:TPA: 50S ribosomal protein L3 [Candidatus Woesearchaeota archaeon]|nr:50S ribosomal protein L3P [uncultured archaeon]HIH11910.1 50S ribosomal protein L3 [Candidatus Woesearchaeota archaeon]